MYAVKDGLLGWENAIEGKAMMVGVAVFLEGFAVLDGGIADVGLPAVLGILVG
jgi:hypothetical protein